MDGGEEVSGHFVEALGEAAQVFHAAEEAFDDIALTVEPLVIRLWFQCVGAVRDDRHCTIINDGLSV